MTMSLKNTDLSMLSSMPLQPQWLDMLGAFGSSDPQIVRASIYMLQAAFRANPTGTLPNTVESVALASKIPQALALAHFKTLTTGYKVVKDSLVFEPLYELGLRLNAQYGQALQDLQDRTVLAIAAPTLFEDSLLPAQGTTLAAMVGEQTNRRAAASLKKGNVKRYLPEDAALTAELHAFISGQGFALNRHDDIWSRFVDYVQGEGVQAVRWSSKFRTWLRNQISWGHLVPDVCAQGTAPGRSAPRFDFSKKKTSAMPSSADRGEIAQQRSMERLERVRMITGSAQPKPFSPRERQV